MIEIIAEEIAGILREWWQGVCICLAFAVVAHVLMAIGGQEITFEGIGKTVVTVMFGVGVLALGFLAERVYRRLRNPR